MTFQVDIQFPQGQLIANSDTPQALRNSVSAGVCFTIALDWANAIRQGTPLDLGRVKMGWVMSRQEQYFNSTVDGLPPMAAPWMRMAADRSYKAVVHHSLLHGYKTKLLMFDKPNDDLRKTLVTKLLAYKAIHITYFYPMNGGVGPQPAAGHTVAIAWNDGKPLYFDPNLCQVSDSDPISVAAAVDELMGLTPGEGWADQFTANGNRRFTLIGIN